MATAQNRLSAGRIHGVNPGPYGNQRTSEYSYPRSLGSMKSLQGSQINCFLGGLEGRCGAVGNVPSPPRGRQHPPSIVGPPVFGVWLAALELLSLSCRHFFPELFGEGSGIRCRYRDRRSRRGRHFLPVFVLPARVCLIYSFPVLV